MISALPEQLKSILTETEVEQFASRIYSKLVSDGIIGSITIESVARNKEFSVRRVFRILSSSDIAFSRERGSTNV